jgi:Lipopolysaccharide kinase (Kdo/WaaP) family
MSPAPRGITPQYVEVRSPAAFWIAGRGCADAIARGQADFLFEERPRAPIEAGSGRGVTARFTLAGKAVVGKRALRGGLFGPLLGGLYLGSRRVLDQVRTSERLRSAGVATPEIVAAGSERVLGPLRAHAIVSHELAGARNLLELAEDAPSPPLRRQLLAACAALVRRMHDAGFLHADLNVGNLVLERGGATPVLNVVDLDHGRFLNSVSPRRRFRNLARLLRSYEKWIAPRLRLSGREELLFLRCYAGRDRALLRRLVRWLSWYRSRLGLRRILWRHAVPRSKDRLVGPLQ